MSDCWVHTVIDFIQRHWRHWCVPKIGCKMKLRVTKLIVQLVIKLNLYYIFFVLMIWWGLFCFVCFFSFVGSSSKLEGGTIQTILDDYDDCGEESDNTEPFEWNSFSCLWVWLLIWCCSQCGNSGNFYNMFVVWDVWWFVVFQYLKLGLWCYVFYVETWIIALLCSRSKLYVFYFYLFIF